MTTTVDVKRAIYQRFLDNWTATPTTPDRVCFGNEKFVPPAGLTWARVSIRHSESQQYTLGDVGSRKFNRRGRVFVQCFSPLDAGEKTADTMAQNARTVYESVRLVAVDVVFLAAITREIGELDGWYQINVEVPFDHVELR